MSTTLSSEIEKIVSARKRAILLCVAGIALVVATTFSLLSFVPKNAGIVTIKSGGVSYQLRVAATPAQRSLGLGKRSSLPSNQGMLFVFRRPATECFWMKDMHFPLDMVWLSNSKRVEFIKSNISPNTYPQTFCPNVSAKYVIELNAGQAKHSDIHTGEVLSF